MKRFLIILFLLLFWFNLTANIEFDRDTLKVVYENSMVSNGQLDTACVYVKNISTTNTVSIFMILPIANWINSYIFDDWDILPLDSAPIYLVIDTSGLMPDIYKGKLKVKSNANNITLPLLLDLYTGLHSGTNNQNYNISEIIITNNYILIKNIDIQEINIYNIKGQLVYKNNTNYINIKNYVKGTYILQIYNLITKKFIKL